MVTVKIVHLETDWSLRKINSDDRVVARASWAERSWKGPAEDEFL